MLNGSWLVSFLIVGTPGAERPITDHLQLRLLCHGSVRLTPATWTFPDLVAPFWRLYVNFDSGASVIPSQQRLELVPRRVYLVPAWLHFATECSHPVRHFYVHFDLPLLQASSRRRPCKEVLHCPLPFPWRKLAPLAQRLSARSASPSDLALLRMLVSGALAEVLDEDQGAPPFSLPPPVSGRLSAVIELIDSDLAAPLKSTDLARAARCSVPQLYRIFGTELGMSPAAYVRERRVATAATRLVSSDASLESIASECGFSDRFHFTRVFSQLMGMPPARYRASVGETPKHSS